MFSLSTEQDITLKEWLASHEPKYCGAIGGRYTYIFTPTTLGCVVKVLDNLTKEEIDLTDYNEW